MRLARVAKVKAIVVTGQGAMFCGGAEITERLGDSGDIWLVGGFKPWNFMTFQKQLGISSSQLTKSDFSELFKAATRDIWEMLSGLMVYWCLKNGGLMVNLVYK